MNIKNQEILNNFESCFIKFNIQNIRVGDIVEFGIIIEESKKTRIQEYPGLVIAKKGFGLTKTITVRRIFKGVGIEKCFLINAEKVSLGKIENITKIRRSKLYFLRRSFHKINKIFEKEEFENEV